MYNEKSSAATLSWTCEEEVQAQRASLLVMSPEESTEGYHNAILLIDRATQYRWAY